MIEIKLIEYLELICFNNESTANLNSILALFFFHLYPLFEQISNLFVYKR